MVPPARIRAVEVGGRSAGGGDAASPDRALEEQRQRLLDGGDGVAGGAFVAVQGAAQQTVPQRLGGRVGAQDLLGLRVLPGVGDPRRAPRRGRARRARRRGSRPAGPWRTRRRRTGRPGRRTGRWRRVMVPAANALRPPFGEHRVLAPGDRVPDQLGGAGGEVEGVEDRHRPVGCAAGRARVRNRSSGLVRVTSAAPGASSSAGTSRSRVLPEPWGPMTQVVRS